MQTTVHHPAFPMKKGLLGLGAGAAAGAAAAKAADNASSGGGGGSPPAQSAQAPEQADTIPSPPPEQAQATQAPEQSEYEDEPDDNDDWDIEQVAGEAALATIPEEVHKSEQVKYAVYGGAAITGFFVAGPLGALVGAGAAYAARHFGYGYFGTQNPAHLVKDL